MLERKMRSSLQDWNQGSDPTSININLPKKNLFQSTTSVTQITIAVAPYISNRFKWEQKHSQC